MSKRDKKCFIQNMNLQEISQATRRRLGWDSENQVTILILPPTRSVKLDQLFGPFVGMHEIGTLTSSYIPMGISKHQMKWTVWKFIQ